MKNVRKNKMQIVLVNEHGNVDQLELSETCIPKPESNEVLIKVVASGVNPADIDQRKGLYPAPKGASSILGLEVAGIVVEVGNKVTQYQIGDRVMALIAGGGYAEYALAHADLCFLIPENLDYIQAAAIPEASFTVWSMLIQKAELTVGETLLVHGGTGGVGSFAIQLARQLNIKVIATAGTDEKCRICYSLGADKVINYNTEDFYPAIQEFTKNTGVDVILDVVGNKYFERNINLLRRCGRLAHIDCQGSSITNLDLTPVITKNLSIMGAVLRPRPLIEKIFIADAIRKNILPLLIGGMIKPLISKVFNFKDVRLSHTYIESGNQIGKVILTFNNL